MKFPDTGRGRRGGVDLGHGDDLDEGMRHTVEVEKLGGRRILLGLGRVLLQLNLLYIHSHPVAVFWGNAIVVEEIHVAVSGKGFCDGSVVRRPSWENLTNHSIV